MTVRRRGWFVLLSVLSATLCQLGSTARPRAEEAAEPPFQPAEISIGEPLQLPERRFPAVPSHVAPEPQSDTRRDAGVAPAGTQAAGNGWIGLTVDDKVVTGRLVVVDVATAGPADRAGIERDDQLLAIDGVPLRSADQLAAALAAIAPGSTVKVAIGRGAQIEERSLVARSRPVRPPARGATPDWQSAETSAPGLPAPSAAPRVATPAPAAPAVPAPARAAAPIPSAAAPAPSTLAAPAPGRGRTALGVRTLPVDPTAQERFRLAEPAGALVIGVVQDLPASKAGVPPGSVIVALDNQPVRSPSELTRIVTSGPVGRPVTLQYIMPGGEQRRAEVSLQSLEVPLEQALVGPEP